jgi:hypothetical protein
VASLAIPAEGDTPLSLSDMKLVSAWRQMCVLLWRHWKSYPRNLSYNGTRVLVTLVIACCFGSLYQGRVRWWLRAPCTGECSVRGWRA